MQDEIDLHERMLRVELGLQHIREKLDAHIEQQSVDLAEIKQHIMLLTTDAQKQKGFVGGAVVTVSAIWAAIIGIWALVKHKFGG